MVRYDEHAEFQLERRGISKDWVEETLRNPEATETQADNHFCTVFPDAASCYAW
jgi:hypothetical protein